MDGERSNELDPLLERDSELQRLDAALDSACTEHGSLTVVGGPAGIGKSVLLRHVCTRAEERGFLTLTATGDELERTFPFGVASQLLAEPARRGVQQDSELTSGAAGLAIPLLEGQEPVPSSDATSAFPLMHGLHWLVAGLAEQAPLLIAVDDAQWADPPSLRFLAYLAQRMDDLPLAVILTLRPGDADPDTGFLLARLGDHHLADSMRLAPLGERSVQELVADELPQAAPELGSAFFAATDGNPFLLRELVSAAREEGVTSPSGVRALRPEAIRASILVRLGRLGDDARRLALAAAVLGPTASPRLAAQLAELDREAAAAAANALVAAHIFGPGEPLAFLHAIIREAVYADLPLGARRRDHLRAARLLRDAGKPAEEVSSHILLSDPVGEDWVAATLREAAALALGRGAPATALPLLKRALEEPGHQDDPALLLELGRAEIAVADPGALSHLEAARDMAREPQQKVAAHARLGQALYVLGDSEGAFESIRAALDLIPPGTGGAPEAELVLYCMPSGRLVPDLVDDVRALLEHPRQGAGEAATPAELARRAVLAYDSLMRGEREAATASLEWLREQTEEGHATPDMPALMGSAVGLCLCFLGRYRDAQAAIEGQVERAGELGNLLDLAVSLEARICAGWLRGDVNACSADVETLLGLNEEGWETATVATRAIAAELALERNDRGAAEATLAPAEEVEERLPGTLGWPWLPYGRTRLAMQAKDWGSALEQALTTGERLLAIQLPSPDYLPWRSLAGRAAARLGEHKRALALIEEELELARSIGSPRATGVALAALGTIRGPDDGLEHLHEAVAELDRTEAELEQARARFELGVALRRARRAREARRPLREASEAARRLGAESLARQALGELRAAGGEPRSLTPTGVESLTPAQLRVAERAAEGLSNREIAEALFVTRRTVEAHLTQVYAKLEISSRDQLPAALGADPGEKFVDPPR